MKTLCQSFLVSIGTLALAGAAYAQVPAGNDTSDTTHFNTGMGTGALVHVTPGSCSFAVGCFDTASGDEALYANTTGSHNESVGNHTTGNKASFMRVAGVTYDLVTLINPADLLQPYVTFADPSVRINDLGVIAVIGTDSRSGLSHVYLLKPI